MNKPKRATLAFLDDGTPYFDVGGPNFMVPVYTEPVDVYLNMFSLN